MDGAVWERAVATARATYAECLARVAGETAREAAENAAADALVESGWSEDGDVGTGAIATGNVAACAAIVEHHRALGAIPPSRG